MAAEHAVGLAIHHELHQHALVAARQRVLHRAEAGLVDVDPGELLAGLRLGEADRADLGLGEDGGGNKAVIDLHVLAAEHRVGEGMALADGDGGEVGAVGDIAHRIDRGHGRARIIIDLHGQMGVEFHARPVQPQVHHIGNAAGGEHDLAGAEARAVIQRDAHAGTGAFDSRHIRVGANLDALLLHLAGKMGADVLVEVAQDLLAAIDQHRLDAEP